MSKFIIMLQILQIKNWALVTMAQLEWQPGFIALTGETGAGKSVLLAALRFLAGMKADKGVIAQGADSCWVQAVLTFEAGHPLHAALEQLHLPPCEEGALVLSRELFRSKPQRITINGQLSTLQQLSILGQSWVDFHGPGQQQQLFKPNYQLAMLDAFAGNADCLAQYRFHYTQWQEATKAMEHLRHNEVLSEDEQAFVKQQIELIQRAAPSLEAIETLESQYNKLMHSQELQQLAGGVAEGLGSQGRGALALLQGQVRLAQGLLKIIPHEVKELYERLQSLVIECQDLAREYEALAQSSLVEPELARQLNDSMQQWLEVKRKYGPAVQHVLAKKDQLQSRLVSQDERQVQLLELEAKTQKHLDCLRPLADTLGLRRQEAAGVLGQKISEVLGQLGFKNPGLRIDIQTDAEYHSWGNTRCVFLFAPNVGQAFLPLDKIASCGEAARVMLAIKCILAAQDPVPVWVFDEIDANVGGEIAVRVGLCMLQLAQGRQVVNVTHLPQVASLAHQHWLVHKAQDGQATEVTFRLLTPRGQDRVEELARMLGDRQGMHAVLHAQALLQQPYELHPAFAVLPG